MGGRLDATNVIRVPAVSVVTTVQLDHCKILGDTIEAIGREKAGIFKPDSVYGALVGPGTPLAVMQVPRPGSPGRLLITK